MASDITIGIDIGTSSVKAVAVDGDGTVVADAKVPHAFHTPSADRFEHEGRCWHDGPLAALDALSLPEAAGVSVSAMVPSLTAVDAAGVPTSVGLLYGDERGRASRSAEDLAERGEFGAFLRWFATAVPDAAGYWPAQAVANHALGGEALISTTVAATTLPLFDWVGWDTAELAATGVNVDRLPRIVPSLTPCGSVDRLGGAVLEGGTIDAMGEQIVAGADDVGDVLVVCGTTLIVWSVNPEHVDAPGYYCVPHTAAGKWLLGGPSNAGGLFLDWARRIVAEPAREPDPHHVPIWVPYLRGERVPLSDPTRRSALVDLDVTHGPAAVRRAAFEAAGFVTRRMIEASPAAPRRIVAVGGGTLVPEWIQALADCTGLGVHVSGRSTGAAVGTAFVARVAAGLEPDTAAARRWATTRAVVDPDPAWVGPCAERYERWKVVAA